MNAHLFLDTNIFLHFKQFDQINWKDLLSVEDFKILIPSIVIMELDKHKVDKNERITKQAKRIIKLLDKYSDTDTSPELVKIEFITKESKPITFENNELDKEVSDDRLLASIIEYKSNQNINVILVSNDLGIKLKAKRFDIKVFQLNEDLQLKLENNLTEKRIKELEKENALIKNRIPDLKIYFTNKELFVKYPLKKVKIEKYNIEDKIRELKIKFPYKTLEKENPNSKLSELGRLLNLDLMRQGNVDWYNKGLDRYFEEYKQYIEDFIEYGKTYFKSYDVNLIIINEGSVPADDIHINIHIPDGMDILDKNDYPYKPEEPKAPQLINTFDLFGSNLNIAKYAHYNPITSPNIRFPNVSGLSIKKTNSYDIDTRVKRLMHHKQIKLDTFFVVFKDYKSAFSFDFDYTIIAENTPNEITGKLKFIIDK